MVAAVEAAAVVAVVVVVTVVDVVTDEEFGEVEDGSKARGGLSG